LLVAIALAWVWRSGERRLTLGFRRGPDYFDRRRAISAWAWSRALRTTPARSCGQPESPTVRHRSQAVTASDRRAVPVSCCNERTVGLHAAAEQLRQGWGCPNRIRNQQDEKRASQTHASLRSLWRATMILLSKTSPLRDLSVMLHREPSSGDSVRPIRLALFAVCFSARRLCIACVRQHEI
jgi:hypothetical protein